MAWTDIMTSAHAALARAEWAFEAEIHNRVTRELRIATAQAMLARLKAHYPNSPIRYGYASVLRDFGADAHTSSSKAVLRLHFRTANLAYACQSMSHGVVTGLPTRARFQPASETLRALLETPHGAIRHLEEELEEEGQCGD